MLPTRTKQKSGFIRTALLKIEEVCPMDMASTLFSSQCFLPTMRPASEGIMKKVVTETGGSSSHNSGSIDPF